VAGLIGGCAFGVGLHVPAPCGAAGDRWSPPASPRWSLWPIPGTLRLRACVCMGIGPKLVHSVGVCSLAPLSKSRRRFRHVSQQLGHSVGVAAIDDPGRLGPRRIGAFADKETLVSMLQ